MYRLMYHELRKAIDNLTEPNSIKLWNWLIKESKCIYDGIYARERLFNSDFTYDKTYKPTKKALNDWRRSGWKLELERMLKEQPYLLTEKEKAAISQWQKDEKKGVLQTTYDGNERDVLVNAIKEMEYYKK